MKKEECLVLRGKDMNDMFRFLVTELMIAMHLKRYDAMFLYYVGKVELMWLRLHVDEEMWVKSDYHEQKGYEWEAHQRNAVFNVDGIRFGGVSRNSEPPHVSIVREAPLHYVVC